MLTIHFRGDEGNIVRVDDVPVRDGDTLWITWADGHRERTKVIFDQNLPEGRTGPTLLARSYLHGQDVSVDLFRLRREQVAADFQGWKRISYNHWKLEDRAVVLRQDPRGFIFEKDGEELAVIPRMVLRSVLNECEE